jgi:hypothetical protein
MKNSILFFVISTIFLLVFVKSATVRENIFLLFKYSCKFYINIKAGDQFYDNRCICICPSFTVIGEEETHRKVYIDVLNKENWLVVLF